MIIKVLKNIGNAFAFVSGRVGSGLYLVGVALINLFSSAHDPMITQFKNDVDQALQMYIETDLKSIENSINMSRTRHTRCRAIIMNYKQIIEMTQEEFKKRDQKHEQLTLVDHLGLKNDENLIEILQQELKDIESRQVGFDRNDIQIEELIEEEKLDEDQEEEDEIVEKV